MGCRRHSFALNESSVCPTSLGVSARTWLDGAGPPGRAPALAAAVARRLTSLASPCTQRRSAATACPAGARVGPLQCVEATTHASTAPMSHLVGGPLTLRSCNNQTHQNTPFASAATSSIRLARANDVCNVCGGNGNHRAATYTARAPRLDECGTPCCATSVFERAHVLLVVLIRCSRPTPCSQSSALRAPCFLMLCF